MKKRIAQVWVETVVYTLIGISLIGVVLAIAKPKIESIQDRIIIEQTIEFFNQIHSKVLSVQDSAGNQQPLVVKLSKGKLILNGEENFIIWEMPSSYQYSQLDVTMPLGKIDITTLSGPPQTIKLLLNYSELNLTVNEEESTIVLDGSPMPYNLIFRNDGARLNIRIAQ